MENPEKDHEREEFPGSGSGSFSRQPETEKLPDGPGLVITFMYPDMSSSTPVYVFEGYDYFNRVTLDDHRDYFIVSVVPKESEDPEEHKKASIYKIDPEDLSELNLLNLAGACEPDNLLSVLQIGDCEDIRLVNRGLDFPDTLRIEYCSEDDLNWGDQGKG